MTPSPAIFRSPRGLDAYIERVLLDPRRGTVGLWPLQDNANEIARRYDGTAAGGVSFSQSGPLVNGEVGRATALNGSTGKCAIVGSGITALDNAYLTMTAWVLPVALTGSFPRLIDRTYNGQFALYLNAANNGIGVALVGNGSSVDRNAVAQNVITLNQWQMITAVYDGSTTKAYRNGVLVGFANDALGTLKPYAGNLTLGSRTDGEGRYFAGSLALVQVCNVAWTADQVAEAYLAAMNGV
jgi:hypothetical protein